MKMLGLIAGMSWESSAVYYRLLNAGVKARLGGLHSARIILWSVDFAEIAALQEAGDWDSMTDILTKAAQGLERAGAQALLICTNTMHKIASEIEQSTALPLLHIADATASAIIRTPSRRPVLLATRYTMEQDFYKERLKRRGIDPFIPNAQGRMLIHQVIYDELCRGVVKPESKKATLDMIADLRTQGADGVILGCTEIGMMLSQADLDIPVFDTTLLHAQAALDFAVG